MENTHLMLWKAGRKCSETPLAWTSQVMQAGMKPQNKYQELIVLITHALQV